MDDQIELKPCPFCGFEKPFLTNCEYRKSMWTIRCPNCKIEITVPVFRQKWGNVYCGNEVSNRKRLIEAWNRREVYLQDTAAGAAQFADQPVLMPAT